MDLMRPVILVVEDDAKTRELLREVLQQAGYAVQLASDGVAGLARVADGGIDLVLLDRTLPKLDGLELCRQARTHGGPVYLPIIMLTGLDDDAERHAGFAAGADDYISKPFAQRELLDRVQAWLRAHQRLQASHERLRHLAFHDALTDLPNRTLFMGRLAHALARARRHDQSVAVLFLDLDNFKLVNDSLGHQAGDRLLAAAAERVTASLREVDTAARLGGDEFAILLEDVSGVPDATRVAERIQERLSGPFSIDGHELFVSASIGIALSSREQDQPEMLMRDSDIAMYCAKSNGKARYELFDNALKAHVTERLVLENDLRRAIERREFQVYYQPIVHLASGRIAEAEALVRWEHPRRGLVSPADFIPLAEETGLIVPLGQWVMAEACRQTRQWQLQYPARPPLVISVNLSTRQFQHPGLVEETAQMLDTIGLDPRHLKLEITESMMMHDAEAAIATLQRLKALGIQLAIDDFGTGYSSMATLKQCPIDVLKIDRSFIHRLGQDPRDQAIVRTIITLAQTLDLAVTSEGVETAEQLAQLCALTCDYGQGYYFSRPVPSEGMTALLGSAVVLPGAGNGSVSKIPAGD